jgi:hypothetical protein
MGRALLSSLMRKMAGRDSFGGFVSSDIRLLLAAVLCETQQTAEGEGPQALPDVE